MPAGFEGSHLLSGFAVLAGVAQGLADEYEKDQRKNGEIVVRAGDYEVRYGGLRLAFTTLEHARAAHKAYQIERAVIQYFARLDTLIDVEKTLLIKYYQGDDPCSTSGSATKQSRDEYFSNFKKKILKKEITKITKSKLLVPFLIK